MFPKRDSGAPDPEPRPEPKMEQVLAEWKAQPVSVVEEVMELVACRLWDVFSDNHKVVAADGRIVDFGSFRGASVFLDEYLTEPSGEWGLSAGFRFYMGSVWISFRADLTPVYRMIFRKLRSQGADWQYQSAREWGLKFLAATSTRSKSGEIKRVPMKQTRKLPPEVENTLRFISEQRNKSRSAKACLLVFDADLYERALSLGWIRRGGSERPIITRGVSPIGNVAPSGHY